MLVVTDQRLRDLERQWGKTGTDEDEASLLLEQVRAGVLDGHRLELGAYLEHPAALRALGLEAQPLSDEEDRVLWLRGLSYWGREALCRGLVAWLMSQAGEHEAWSPAFRQVASAVEQWWACPSSNAAETVHDAFADVNRADPGRASLACDLSIVIGVFHRDPVGRQQFELLNQIHQTAIHSPLPAPASIRNRVWTWAKSTLNLEPQGTLVGGRNLRQRVIDATTPPLRRRVVARLRESSDRTVVLVHEDGKRLEVSLFSDACGYESFLAFCSGSPLCRMSLATIVGVEPVA